MLGPIRMGHRVAPGRSGPWSNKPSRSVLATGVLSLTELKALAGLVREVVRIGV